MNTSIHVNEEKTQIRDPKRIIVVASELFSFLTGIAIKGNLVNEQLLRLRFTRALGAGKVEFKFLLKVHKVFSNIQASYYMLVNNALKTLPKKRRHQMARNLSVHLSEASMLRYQALWYASFIVVYIWFLFWVSYDFFVLHKPIAEINVVNYVGSVAAIVFMWAGTKILKRDRINVGNLQLKLLPQKPPQQKPLQKAVAVATTTATTANSACAHYFGYLNQRQKQQEIPAECLTCADLIKCMGSTN